MHTHNITAWESRRPVFGKNAVLVDLDSLGSLPPLKPAGYRGHSPANPFGTTSTATSRNCLMLTSHQHHLSTSWHLPTRDATNQVCCAQYYCYFHSGVTCCYCYCCYCWYLLNSKLWVWMQPVHLEYDVLLGQILTKNNDYRMLFIRNFCMVKLKVFFVMLLCFRILSLLYQLSVLLLEQHCT